MSLKVYSQESIKSKHFKGRTSNISLLLKTLQWVPNDEQVLPYPNPLTSLTSFIPTLPSLLAHSAPPHWSLRAFVLGVSWCLKCYSFRNHMLFSLTHLLQVFTQRTLFQWPCLHFHQSLRLSSIHMHFPYPLASFTYHLPQSNILYFTYLPYCCLIMRKEISGFCFSFHFTLL